MNKEAIDDLTKTLVEHLNKAKIELDALIEKNAPVKEFEAYYADIEAKISSVTEKLKQKYNDKKITG